ncbi:MAG: CDP-alcohol phosphatidyltransferase family protein [Pseudomonadales bacterium]
MSESLSNATASLLTAANLLTLSRALIALPCAFFITEQHWVPAAVLFTAAALSDYFDGRVARAAGQSSVAGGVFDHATDAWFVSLCLGAGAYTDQVTLWLAPLIVLAFLQYVLDSSVLQGKPLRANWLGRGNGIAYFVLTGFVIGIPLLQSWFPRLSQASDAGVYLASVLIALSTATSMCIRAAYWWRYRD